MCHKENNLLARTYFHNGPKKRVNRRMEGYDWQVTTAGLFTPLFFFFLYVSLPSFSRSSFTRQTGCLFGLAAAAKCNLSVTEVLVMFNPF